MRRTLRGGTRAAVTCALPLLAACNRVAAQRTVFTYTPSRLYTLYGITTLNQSIQSLCIPKRSISSLHRLLREERDVFLDAVQTLELTRIADLAEGKTPVDTNTTSSNIEGEAATQAVEQPTSTLGDDEGRQAQHLYEALCAVNAVLRVLCEDGPMTLPQEELQAAMRVYCLVRRTRGTNTTMQAKWADDFVPEVNEFALLYRRAGGSTNKESDELGIEDETSNTAMEDIDVAEGGYYENVNDEDEQELLRGLPCAFDESAPPEADTLHTTPTSNTLCEPTKSKTLLEDEQRGVVNFPPLHGSSFMLRGDNGIVRWVTTKTRTQHNNYTRKINETMTSAECEADDAELQVSSEDEDDDVELHVLRLQQAQRAAHTTTTSANASSTTELGLLGVESMSYLMHQVYESHAQDQRRKEAQQVQHEGSNVQLSTSSLTNANSGALWVDKYAPRRFRDILSDDAMSLQLLQWLKSWEDYVFGSAHKATTNTSVSEGVTSSSSNADTDGRKVQAALPEERIAVLVGPPGVGKTTLVHVLAKHCGYEVIEVNASMERTTTRIESTIKMAISAMPTPAALQQSRSGRMENNNNIGDGNELHTTNASIARKRSRDVLEGTQLTQRNMNDTTTTTSNDTSSVTLVQHLLRPKCLVLDEMDGIAGNVATFLLEQDIHRPVFCLCNDWYAPALRPLRQRCSHVFRLPPVKAQRLLGRLSYIAASEGVALESAALAELVRVSNGDIRSCINTLQFLVTALRHHSSRSKNITAGQMLRTLQGKDAVFDVWQTWASVFQRRDRARSVLLLQQEYGIDYDALRVQATTQTSSSTSAQLTSHSNAQHNNTTISRGVVDGFHVDPGYLYLAHTLARTTGSTTTTTTTGNTSASNGMSSLLLDGLQENYLQRPYLDYSFSRTARVARGFAEYDVLLSTARLRATSLIPFAERYESCVALLTHVLCSSTTQTTSLSFPRLQARLYERKTAVSHIARSFQHGTAHHHSNHQHDALPAYLTNNEVLVCDIGPMLTRCLYDTALHFPMHATTMTMLPATMQHFIQRSVARHISYGLTYEQSRHYDTSANELGFGASVQGTQSGRTSWSQQRQQTNTTTTTTGVSGISSVGTSEPHWHLVPEMDLFVRAATHDERRWMPSEELKAFMVGEIARQAVRQRALMRSAAQHSHMAGHFIEASEAHVAKKTENKSETPVKPETLIPEKDSTSNTSSKGVVEKVKQTEETSSSPTGTAPPVKRDFFGRPIVTPDTSSSHNTNRSTTGGNSLLSLMNGTLGMKRTHNKASSLGSSGALSHAQNRPKVRYVYHDGATNAVKMDATFQDFA